MELWFTEEHTKNVRFSIKVKEQLASYESEFQQIDIFDTYEFGRILTLDGYLMLTEKDEFIYHEMMVHIPMCTNPNIKKVLVIGAGDGGTIRELARYQTIEAIDMVEIDDMVVALSKEFLPQTTCSLEDPRLKIYYEDGLRFVRSKVNYYDLILVDSTDPFGPGEDLFTKEFYGNCYQALNENGILINQHESPYYAEDARAMVNAHRKLRSVFPIAKIYQFHLPTYPSGHWLFGFASKRFDPVVDGNTAEWEQLGIITKYYNPELHRASFALPNYVKEMLDEA